MNVTNISDDEDLIDRLEKETLKTKKEAEEEEPDYDIEGELAGKDGEGSDDEGKKDDAANKDWKKASVEEVFERFDEDKSGFIDFDEFKLMLPELGVNISEAKALKYFRQCDTANDDVVIMSQEKLNMIFAQSIHRQKMATLCREQLVHQLMACLEQGNRFWLMWISRKYF